MFFRGGTDWMYYNLKEEKLERGKNEAPRLLAWAVIVWFLLLTGMRKLKQMCKERIYVSGMVVMASKWSH